MSNCVSIDFVRTSGLYFQTSSRIHLLRAISPPLWACRLKGLAPVRSKRLKKEVVYSPADGNMLSNKELNALSPLRINGLFCDICVDLAPILCDSNRRCYLAQCCLQCRQLGRDYKPHHIEINTQIVVTNDVAKTRNGTPTHIWSHCLSRFT